MAYIINSTDREELPLEGVNTALIRAFPKAMFEPYQSTRDEVNPRKAEVKLEGSNAHNLSTYSTLSVHRAKVVCRSGSTNSASGSSISNPFGLHSLPLAASAARSSRYIHKSHNASVLLHHLDAVL